MTTYPLADKTTQWWDDDWGWDVIIPNVYVLHTTEGLGWPVYSSDGKAGAKAPHMTGKPDFTNRRINFRQHFANEHSSRALQNLSGGVTTNTNNAFQIELIGTCDDALATEWKIGTRTYKQGVDYLYWPAAPDWALQSVADHMKYLHEKFPKFPIRSTVEFANYDSRKGGLQKNVRLSGSEWNNYYGILGHQHVPENYHGDPGKFPIARLIDLALGGPVATATSSSVSLNVGGTVLAGHDVVVRASSSPITPGVHVFEFQSGGTWREFARRDVADGSTEIEWRFGSTNPFSHPIRVRFLPKDTTKFAASTSPAFTVTGPTVQSLLDAIADLDKRVDALEAKQTP